jgi:hypothetical protein
MSRRNKGSPTTRDSAISYCVSLKSCPPSVKHSERPSDWISNHTIGLRRETVMKVHENYDAKVREPNFADIVMRPPCNYVIARTLSDIPDNNAGMSGFYRQRGFRLNLRNPRYFILRMCAEYIWWWELETEAPEYIQLRARQVSTIILHNPNYSTWKRKQPKQDNRSIVFFIRVTTPLQYAASSSTQLAIPLEITNENTAIPNRNPSLSCKFFHPVGNFRWETYLTYQR